MELLCRVCGHVLVDGRDIAASVENKDGHTCYYCRPCLDRAFGREQATTPEQKAEVAV